MKLLVIFLGYLPFLFFSTQAFSQSSLIRGEIESPSDTFNFIIVMDGDRALSGIATPSIATFTWVDGSENVVQVDFGEAADEGALPWEGREFRYVGLKTSEQFSSEFGSADRVFTAPFSQVFLAVMFRDPYLGIGNFKPDELKAFSNEYGKLSVTRTTEGSVESIHFHQVADNTFSATAGGMKLIDSTYPFPDGTQGTSHAWLFIRPLRTGSDSWSAKCVRTSTSPSGQTDEQTKVVHVTSYVEDADVVKRTIDSFLNQIPEGTRVLSRQSDPIAYVWSDARVSRNLGSSAVAVAAEAEFKSSTTRRWLWFLAILTIISVLAVCWIRRQSGASTE